MSPLLSLFSISPAWAQDAPASGGGNILVQLFPLILIFVVFWFLLIRPQTKRAREHREMVSNLKRGDQVITGGGIHGVVTRDNEDATIEVEIAEDVYVKVARQTVAVRVPRGGDKSDDDKGGKGDNKNGNKK